MRMARPKWGGDDTPARSPRHSLRPTIGGLPDGAAWHRHCSWINGLTNALRRRSHAPSSESSDARDADPEAETPGEGAGRAGSRHVAGEDLERERRDDAARPDRAPGRDGGCRLEADAHAQGAPPPRARRSKPPRRDPERPG